MIAVPVLRPVFRYSFAVVSALVFGALLFSLFSIEATQGTWLLLAFMILCGIIGYFVAEMLLQKSFRVFGTWKGCAALMLCLAVLFCVVRLDLLGFEDKVPAPEDVASVEVVMGSFAPYDMGTTVQATYTDQQRIAMVTAIHSAIVQDKEHFKDDAVQSVYTTAVPDEGSYRNWVRFKVTYTTTRGAVITRMYSSLGLDEEMLRTEGSAAYCMERLIERPDVIREMYDLDLLQEGTPEQIYVTVCEPGPEGNTHEAYLRKEDHAALLEAVLADLEAGDLGRHYVIENEERWANTCINDLYIDYQVDLGVPGRMSSGSVVITLTPHAVRTIAVLKEAGILDDTHLLMTHQAFNEMTGGQ